MPLLMKFVLETKMKIKVFIPGGYKIIMVDVQDGVKSISEKYQCWEYVL